MSGIEKDPPLEGRPPLGSGSDLDPLERNLDRLLAAGSGPLLMEAKAKDRILSALKQRISEPSMHPVPISEKLPGKALLEGQALQPEKAAGRGRFPLKDVLAVSSIAALLAVGAWLGLSSYRQAQKQKEEQAARMKREKKMQAELARLKLEQEALKKISEEKAELLRKLRMASKRERDSIRTKLFSLNKKEESLKESINKYKARGLSRQLDQSRPPRPPANPLDGL